MARRTLIMIAASLVLAACSGGSDETNNASSPDVASDASIDAGGNEDASSDTGGADASVDVGSPDAAAPDAGADVAEPGDVGPPPDDLDPLGGRWSDDFATPGMLGGAEARVTAFYRDDETGEVYAGGTFLAAGNTPVQNVAVWQGTSWAPLGDGVDIQVQTFVRSRDGELYAAGASQIGGSTNDISAWDGSQWTSVGAVAPASGEVNEMVRLPNGDILVGGDFSALGGTPAANLARLTESGFEPMSGGQPNGAVTAIEQTASGYCIAGDFTEIGGLPVQSVACWDGTSWSAMGKGLPSGVRDLLALGNGEFLAGGTFGIGDPRSGVVVGLAKFDGTEWTGHAGGVQAALTVSVDSLYLGPSDEVYVGGRFGGVGEPPIPAAGIARLDGETWSDVQKGVGGSLHFTGIGAGVDAITMLPGGQLVVGGAFSQADQTFAVNIALHDGSDWHAMVGADDAFLGVNGNVADLALADDGSIWAVGDFPQAGAASSPDVARLVGDHWESVGQGIDSGSVHTVAVDGDKAYIGGGFRFAGPNGVSYVAQWDGREWQRMGAGPDGSVDELLVAPDGRVFAVGDFEKADGKDAGGVAYWNGGTWETLGGGLRGSVGAIAIADDGTIYVGGGFEKSAVGDELNYLARWDGSTWVDVEGGANGYIMDLAFVDGELLVSGRFDTIGGVKANSVARLTDGGFEPLGEGLASDGMQGSVYALAPKANGIFAAGNFSKSGNTRLADLAWWDGQSWHSVGGGFRGGATALLIHEHSLYVGGGFTTVDGIPSYKVARWEYGE